MKKSPGGSNPSLNAYFTTLNDRNGDKVLTPKGRRYVSRRRASRSPATVGTAFSSSISDVLDISSGTENLLSSGSKRASKRKYISKKPSSRHTHAQEHASTLSSVAAKAASQQQQQLEKGNENDNSPSQTSDDDEFPDSPTMISAAEPVQQATSLIKPSPQRRRHSLDSPSGYFAPRSPFDDSSRNLTPSTMGSPSRWNPTISSRSSFSKREERYSSSNSRAPPMRSGGDLSLSPPKRHSSLPTKSITLHKGGKINQNAFQMRLEFNGDKNDGPIRQLPVPSQVTMMTKRRTSRAAAARNNNNRSPSSDSEGEYDVDDDTPGYIDGTPSRRSVATSQWSTPSSRRSDVSELVSPKILMGYLQSVGVEPDVAESIASDFLDQQLEDDAPWNATATTPRSNRKHPPPDPSGFDASQLNFETVNGGSIEITSPHTLDSDDEPDDEESAPTHVETPRSRRSSAASSGAMMTQQQRMPRSSRVTPHSPAHSSAQGSLPNDSLSSSRRSHRSHRSTTSIKQEIMSLRRSSRTSRTTPPSGGLSSSESSQAAAGEGLSNGRGGHRYPRFSEPGAVVMSGRAFGAPRRPEMPTPPRTPTNASDNFIVEAQTVGDEPVVDGRKLSFCQYLRANLLRCAIFGVVLIAILGATIGIVVIFLQRGDGGDGSGGNSSGASPIPSPSPTAIPTIVNSEILQAAADVSGWDVVQEEGSPQRRAVGWLSTVGDRLEGERFVQRYALVVLYYGTGGESWLTQENWLDASKHECDWAEDISCRELGTGHRIVVGLDLTRNGLTGNILNETSRFDQLESFKAAHNNLVGTIPESVCLLTSLTLFDVQDNEITGSIPLNFGNATDLEIVNMSRNKLTGTLPMSMYDLTVLQEIDLSFNKISGGISRDIGRLQALRSFRLHNNKLTGRYPLEFDQILNLDFIHLDNNQLTGTFPPLNGVSASRLEITLSHNLMSGTISVENNREVQAPQRYSIYMLDLSFNNFTGTISPVLSVVVPLKHFDVSGNSFDGPFPSTPVGWRHLEYLSIVENQFTGPLPTSFGPNLRHIDSGGNQFGGTLPSDLCRYDRLEYIGINDNGLNGTFDPCLGSVTNLVAINAHNNEIAGPIPAEFGILQNLKFLHLANNSLTGTIPTELGEMVSARTIDLESNILMGSIPSELGNLSFLRVLKLANNALTGTVPESLDNLANLGELTVAGNDLEGNVGVKLCQNMKVLPVENIGCKLQCDCCSDPSKICGEATVKKAPGRLGNPHRRVVM